MKLSEGVNKQYLKHVYKFDLSYIRIMLSFCVIIYALFSLLDFVAAADSMNLLLIIRFAIVIPLFFFGILFSYHKSFYLFHQYILTFLYVMAGLSIVIMIMLEPQAQYCGGLFLIFGVGYFLTRMRWAFVSFGSLLIIIVFIFMTYMFSKENITSHMIFAVNFFGFNIIGLYGSIVFERYRKDKFLREDTLIRSNVILEKRAAELAISNKTVTESLEYARDVIEASLDPFITISQDGLIIDANKAIEIATGLTRDKLINTDFCDYFINSEMAKIGYQKALKDEKIIDYMLQLKNINGSSISVLCNMAVYKNKEGQIIGLFVAARDISKIIKTQDELIKLNENLELLVEGRTVQLTEINAQLVNSNKELAYQEEKISVTLNSIGDAVIATGLDGVINFLNLVAESLTGWTQDEAIGRPIEEVFNIISELTKEKSENIVENVIKTGIIHELPNHTMLLSKDGVERPIEDSAAPITNSNGEILGVVVVFRDLSEKQQKKEELELIMNSTAEGVFGVNRDGYCTFVNKRFLKLLGYKNGEEIIGKDIHKLIHHSYEDGTHFSNENCEMIKAIFRGEYLRVDNILWRKDGTSFPASYACNPQVKNGNIIGAVVSFKDITERINYVKSLKESESNLLLAQNIAKIGSWELEIGTNRIWGSEESFKILELDRTSEFLDYYATQKMICDEDRKKQGEAINNLIQFNKLYNVTFKLNTTTGKIKYINSRASLEFDEENKPIKVIGIIHDITDLKEKELELEYLAYHDYLTGLHNRRYYEENLAELDVVENHPITIVMADINGLKLINDAFGHLSGDELLISAANLIADNCRETDLLARIGGDEFVIIMPKTDEKVAEKIVKEINEKSKLIKTQSIPLSISFGYTSKTLESEDIQDVYRSTEDFMYREKLLEIPSMRSSAIETILNTLYEKDIKSEVHSRDVSQLSERLAKAYGMTRQDVAEVKTAGLLHDIGKIIIPLSIITKEGKLTKKEYLVIKSHSEIGFRILNSTQDMRGISNIVLNHHERWDGNGYPRGIKSEKIPVKSRIIAIADAFDAMTSERTYRDIISKEEALKEILDNSGTQFDPDLVKVFENHFTVITAK